MYNLISRGYNQNKILRKNKGNKLIKRLYLKKIIFIEQ